TTGEERPITWRLRRRRDERRAHGIDDEVARAAAQDPHLGPWEGARRSRAVRARYRHEGVLRRPSLALAATDEREHERVAAPVLPEGHRPVEVVRSGSRSRSSCNQQPPPQDSRLENPRRGSRRPATLTTTARCCNDRLNSPSTRRLPSLLVWSRPESTPQSARSATRWTTPWRRPPSARSRTNSSAARARGATSTTSKSKPSTGSTGSTTSGPTITSMT